MWYASAMLSEIFVALALSVGPSPGRSLQSQTPVTEGSPLVALQPIEVDGRTVMAYRHTITGEDDPTQCAQPGNVACRRPRYDRDLKRWQRPETWGEGLARYWQIAQHAGAVAGSVSVLEFMLVIVRHESAFWRSVHEGTNHRPWRRSTKWEDGGRSWCLAQVMTSRNPNTRIPDKKWSKRRSHELVGLDDASTQLCLGLLADRVTRIMKRCGRRGRRVTPACVFLGYAGVKITAKHPLIRARLSTYAKIKTANRVLGPDVRRMIGLPPPKKSKRGASRSSLVNTRHGHSRLDRGMAQWIDLARLESRGAVEWIRHGYSLGLHR